MFEDLAGVGEGFGDTPDALAGVAATPAPMLSTVTVQGWVAALAGVDRAAEDAVRIDLIAVLEQVKGASAAAQAVLTADFAASQRAAQIAAGVPTARANQGVAGQVALARRDSAFRGGRHVGLAQALTRELPATLAALARGTISEWRATIVARETACLDPDLRRAADAELGQRIEVMSDAQVEAAARAVAYRLDPEGFMARTKGATKHRRVSLRPAPDTMSRLTGFLPVALGVAALAALRAHADRLIAAGDPRSRDQVMADTFTARLTGAEAADGVPVEVGLVMTDTTLLGDDNEPADLHPEGGPIPAWAARAMVADTAAQVWVRRLFTHPDTGILTRMDSRRRLFPRGLRRFLILRDQVCRTPWCSAPVRHADHVVAYAVGGATSASNGQGLCAACNYAKQAPGWTSEPLSEPPFKPSTGQDSDNSDSGPAPPIRVADGSAATTVRLTTPTGHTYESLPPPLPRRRQPDDARLTSAPAPAPGPATAAEPATRELSLLELRFAGLLAAA